MEDYNTKNGFFFLFSKWVLHTFFVCECKVWCSLFFFVCFVLLFNSFCYKKNNKTLHMAWILASIFDQLFCLHMKMFKYFLSDFAVGWSLIFCLVCRQFRIIFIYLHALVPRNFVCVIRVSSRCSRMIKKRRKKKKKNA